MPARSALLVLRDGDSIDNVGFFGAYRDALAFRDRGPACWGGVGLLIQYHPIDGFGCSLDVALLDVDEPPIECLRSLE